MFERSPIYFGPDDEGGAAPVEVEPATPAAEAAPVGEVEPGTEATPVVEETAPIDWGVKVTEWGGEDTIAEALQLREALSTRDGVTALMYQAGRALGLGDAAIDALFGTGEATPAGGEPVPTVEELLADDERVVTAADIKRILADAEQKQQAQAEQQRTAQAVLTTIDSTFTDLKIEDEQDRLSILTIADSLVTPDKHSDPAAVATAIRTAHARFEAKVQAAAQAIVKGKAEVAGQQPTPLPTGGSGGTGEVVGEPQTLAEAKARARQQLGIQ